MEQESKKLDIEAAFRDAARPSEIPNFENRRGSLKPLFQAHRSANIGLLRDLFLGLFSLLIAGIAFVAVYRLLGSSPRALYTAMAAAAVIGVLMAPLRYQSLAARTLPFAGVPESEPTPLPSALAKKQADLQRATVRNRVALRLMISAYVLCLWFLSVMNSERLHGMHIMLLTIVLAAPVLLVLMFWITLGPLGKSS
jgi:hypothetical protein